jgi:hypothetical protein
VTRKHDEKLSPVDVEQVALGNEDAAGPGARRNELDTPGDAEVPLH